MITPLSAYAVLPISFTLALSVYYCLPIPVLGFDYGFTMKGNSPTNVYSATTYKQHLYSINLLQQVVLCEIYVFVNECPKEGWRT